MKSDEKAKWRNELKKNITTIEQLKKHINLTLREERQLEKVINIHPMSISRYYISLIDRNDPNDPIRKMAVPSIGELNLLGTYDPSGELENTKLPGVQHKYLDTVLILSTNKCATYCRYCFRKRLIGLPSEEVIRRFDDAVKYIMQHDEVSNVLLSGGDPFVLSNRMIERVLTKIATIPHLKFIRFGSRSVVTFPERILGDDELLSILKKFSRRDRRLYVITQFNHPREITRETTNAIHRLIKNRVILHNQTVLLKGVNDYPDTLVNLMNKLVAIGVSPYYVFQCRPVKRVKRHFQTSLIHGYEVVNEAKKRLNGLSKRFRYVMSHKTGKLEIIGILGTDIYLKYHQAKDPNNSGRLFKKKLTNNAGWLEELLPAEKIKVRRLF